MATRALGLEKQFTLAMDKKMPRLAPGPKYSGGVALWKIDTLYMGVAADTVRCPTKFTYARVNESF
jgi:hypothetical protein